jgi:hypothetical protein
MSFFIFSGEEREENDNWFFIKLILIYMDIDQTQLKASEVHFGNTIQK